MSHPYKRNITRALPSGAAIFHKAGKMMARWTDEAGKERTAKVATNRKGEHRIIVGQQEKWEIAYDTPSGRKTRVAYKDYDSSLALLQRLERESAQRAEGIITSFDDHRKTPISSHLDDFMTNGVRKTVSESYRGQHRKRIERIIGGISATRLGDLEPVKIDRFLDDEKIVGHTRNEYIGSIKAFTRWAAKHSRVERDPLLNLEKTARKYIKPEHPRRAITFEQFQTLMAVAERRPLEEMLLVRKGEKKGTYTAKVSARARAKATRIGFNRRLAYELGMWACLRRDEIEQLCWGDLHLEAKRPVIALRQHATKAKRADVVDIFPPLLASLLAAKPKDAAPSDRVVRNVPSMKTIKADLEAAGIKYENDRGFFDFHALRMTCNTLMATAGVSLSARQKHLRHSDPRLTAITYLDQMHISAAREMLPLWYTDEKAEPQRDTGNSPVEQQAKMPVAIAAPTALMQRRIGFGRPRSAADGNETAEQAPRSSGQRRRRKSSENQPVEGDLANEDAGWQDPASEGDQKRVKGVEPSTFTLAT